MNDLTQKLTDRYMLTSDNQIIIDDLESLRITTKLLHADDIANDVKKHVRNQYVMTTLQQVWHHTKRVLSYCFFMGIVCLVILGLAMAFAGSGKASRERGTVDGMHCAILEIGGRTCK